MNDDVVEQLLAEGFSREEVEAAAAADRLALLPVDRALRPQPPAYSARDVAERSGLPLDVLVSLWRSLGLAESGHDDVVYGEADVVAASGLAGFRAAGLDEETLLRIAQVLGQGMARLSETVLQVVGEALIQPGDDEVALGLRYAQATENLVPPLTPLLGYVLGVHMREQVKAAVVTRAEVESGTVSGARDVTVCFADLVGFTRMGDRVAPSELGDAGRRLTDLAVAAARPPVRLVKMVGDGALLVAPDPAAVVEAALALAAEVERAGEAMPPLRVGLARGLAVADAGDWYGAPVNLASRVSDFARPGSVLATQEVRDAAPAFAWSFAGRRRFKGVRAEVPLYRVRAQ